MLRSHFLSGLIILSLPHTGLACTFFKVTRNGYTMVGNNEDAWSINARIRFENGRPGEFGAVYLGHFNGSPMREMLDQGGMNEAGLMFDGLSVPRKYMPRKEGLPWGDFTTVERQIMRTCSTVHEVAAIYAKYDMGLIAHAMIVFVDRNGDYLVVEGDTLYTGSDATYALGNFRPSTCTNFDAVPIPRYQKGRALIAQGADTSLVFCTAVMDSMRSCRTMLGNGTLYTNIFDPQRGLVHLYFYHDFTEVRTFNLKKELAKGDHEMAMGSLFSRKPEYERLVAYVTPFHQRGLFYALLAMMVCAGIAAFITSLALLRNLIALVRKRPSPFRGLMHFSLLLSSLMMIVLLPFLLTNEGIYYFGLGDAVDDLLPALVYLPLLLCFLTLPLVAWAYQHWRSGRGGTGRWALPTQALMQMALVALLFYWDLVLA
ncbi:MAG: hypothetical protein ABI432_14720 [Flavobacteriales bacterium]